MPVCRAEKDTDAVVELSKAVEVPCTYIPTVILLTYTVIKSCSMSDEATECVTHTAKCVCNHIDDAEPLREDVGCIFTVDSV